MSDKKLKVVFVLGSLRMGGAERMMINLANSLLTRADVTMVRLLDGDDLKSELDPGLRLLSFSCSRTAFALIPLIRFLKRERPNVLISTQIHINLLCRLAAMLSGNQVKVILREATTPGVHFNKNSGFRTFITRMLMKRLYPGADAVVVNAPDAGKDLAAHYRVSPQKITLIYNPVITGNFKRNMLATASHPFFGQAPVYISVGRLAKQKNYPLLLNAFAEVLKHTDARLIIVGEGAERKQLSEKIASMNISGKVDLAGQIANPLPLLLRADVFVLSSDYEGLPNALIEAIACGIQAVSTDSPGGSREILLDGKLGALVPVNDVAALAEAMLIALDKKVPAEELKISAGRFDAETVASRYFSLVNKVCNG